MHIHCTARLPRQTGTPHGPDSRKVGGSVDLRPPGPSGPPGEALSACTRTEWQGIWLPRPAPRSTPAQAAGRAREEAWPQHRACQGSASDSATVLGNGLPLINRVIMSKAASGWSVSGQAGDRAACKRQRAGAPSGRRARMRGRAAWTRAEGWATAVVATNPIAPYNSLTRLTHGDHVALRVRRGRGPGRARA
jgi:hypothetical protein